MGNVEVTYSVAAIFRNYCLMSVVSGWFIAQILKIFTGIFRVREFSFRAMMFGTGGMPSSHSAAVMALCTSVAIKYGFASPLFAISALFCIIVMNDAMGVRYETGKQAKVINQLVKEIFSGQATDVNKNLKELVGHTPLQVLVGALLGTAVPFIMMLIMK